MKRKVRNYVQIAQAGKAGNDILVKSKEISGEEVFINEEIRKMYKEDLGIELKSKKKLLPIRVQLVKLLCADASLTLGLLEQYSQPDLTQDK